MARVGSRMGNVVEAEKIVNIDKVVVGKDFVLMYKHWAKNVGVGCIRAAKDGNKCTDRMIFFESGEKLGEQFVDMVTREFKSPYTSKDIRAWREICFAASKLKGGEAPEAGKDGLMKIETRTGIRVDSI